MKIEKFYKVTYTTKRGYTDTFIGQYCGIEAEYAKCVGCAICEKVGHKRLHQFNIPYNENGDIEDMTVQLDNSEYQTLYFGTACIKKCTIEELA